MAKLKFIPPKTKNVSASDKTYHLKVSTMSGIARWRKRFWMSFVLNLILAVALYYVTNISI